MQYLIGSYATADLSINSGLSFSFYNYWVAMSYLLRRYPNLANNTALGTYNTNLAQSFDGAKGGFKWLSSTDKTTTTWSNWVQQALTMGTIAKGSSSVNYVNCTNYYNLQFFFLVNQMVDSLSNCPVFETNNNVIPLFGTIFQQRDIVTTFMSGLTLAVYGCYAQITEAQATSCVTANVLTRDTTNLLNYFNSLKTTGYSITELNACYDSVNTIFLAALSSMGGKLQECLDIQVF